MSLLGFVASSATGHRGLEPPALSPESRKKVNPYTRLGKEITHAIINNLRLEALHSSPGLLAFTVLPRPLIILVLASRWL